ncbi:MAG: cytidine deaminase [Rhodobacteraceae bacterium]|nr:cytidine deaminase [Paracoccaceae bacterium]
MTLLLEARRLRDMAYAPYSGFQVGAALRSTDGRVFGGCNVENAAYPEGLCAEAGAIAAMVAGGAREIAEIVVVADSPTPVPPCGGCRQKIAEFASADTHVTMVTLSGQERTMTLAELLPGAFGPSHMDKG